MRQNVPPEHSRCWASNQILRLEGVGLLLMASESETPGSSGLQNVPAAATECQRLRSMLRGAEDTIFDLVCSRTTLEQWAEWLRTPLEHAVAVGNADLSAKLQAAGASATLVHPSLRGGQEAAGAAEAGSIHDRGGRGRRRPHPRGCPPGPW